jgi:hypothetical protein
MSFAFGGRVHCALNKNNIMTSQKRKERKGKNNEKSTELSPLSPGCYASANNNDRGSAIETALRFPNDRSVSRNLVDGDLRPNPHVRFESPRIPRRRSTPHSLFSRARFLGIFPKQLWA